MFNKLYKHQEETIEFLLANPKAFCTSTPGCGKTISTITSILKRNGSAIIIAPKSILQAAWGNDIEKFYPNTPYGVLDRKQLKKTDYLPNLLSKQFVILNFEAADLVLKHIQHVRHDTLVIDEFTAIKNRNTKRSKLIQKLSTRFTHRILLSGTPITNSITDIWHPTFILDGGERLGSNFYQFRNAVCQPVQKGHMGQFVEWRDLADAKDVVGSLLRDITIRHELEEVVDMPERVFNTMSIEMPSKLRKAYDTFKETAILELENAEISAVNAAVLGNKLLQIASGSVYDESGKAQLIDPGKYELITELVQERPHSLVFYQWTHQMEILSKIFEAEKIPFAVINGTVSQDQRSRIVSAYQRGEYQTLLIQPQAAAHGLTLTRSSTTIWCSPTFNLEHFGQANHRDYRIGQNKRTQVIMIEYKDTIEETVYKKLQQKQDALTNLLEILKS